MNNLIEAKNISKKYNRKIVLSNCNIEISSKKIYGICGKNGSGKSTLINIMLDLIKPNAGVVHKNFQKGVYYTDIPPSFDNFSVYNYINFFNILNGVAHLSRKRALSILRNNYIDCSLNQKVSSLSYGTKKKLQLIVSNNVNADIYFFDEPFNGLDRDAVIYVNNYIKSIKQASHTAIIISHDYREISHIADEIYVIDNARIQTHIIAANHNSAESIEKEIIQNIEWNC